MKKIAIISFVALLSACSMSTKNITGTYQGTLPCADCDKINAKLVLNADKTYSYETKYFKNKRIDNYSEQGKFTVNKDLITLDENSRNLTFKASKDFVEMTDSQGNVSQSGLNYKLQKVTTATPVETK